MNNYYIIMPCCCFQ